MSDLLFESMSCGVCLTFEFLHSAQPGGRLAHINAGRKRKIADYQASNTNASSTLPTEKKGREDLAWIMCVLQMATRQLALLNKTGQVDFEINVVCRSFTEWIRNIIQIHFQSFFGATLFLSYDRAIAGYVTRQVATTFMATCARHYSECKSITDANTRTLLDMETAPLTVMSTNLAICNGLTHLVDTNLIMVNQIIRDRLGTPVLSTEFLTSLFDESSEINMSGGPFEEIFGWVSQVVQCRDGSEYSMGYIAIPKLGSPEDYNSKESYLESYYGIAKGHYFTYNMAVRECSSKTFDLSGFLNMETSMLDHCRFLSRLGVSFEGLIAHQQNVNNPFMEVYRSTYIFIQNSGSGGPDGAQGNANAGGGGGNNGGGNNNNNNNNQQQNAAPQQQQQAAQAAPQRSAGIGKCWANMIQHLLVTAIQGRSDLHADNMFSFGANLTEFILSRCAPVQSVPAQQIVHESFKHVNDDVLPLRTFVSAKRPEYFVRTINDHGALEYGLATELPAMLGAHPMEDIMHLGSWIQLYTILNAGAKPTRFECFPEYNGRPPELVCGRNYPLVGEDPNTAGTLCLAPDGRTGAFRLVISTLQPTGRWVSVIQPLKDIRDWVKQVMGSSKLMVAPLVFRRHAVFRNSNDPAGVPYVAINFNSATINDDHAYPQFPRHENVEPVRQFLGYSGEYVLAQGRQRHESVHFTDAHERLLPLGTFIIVEKQAVYQFGISCSKAWLKGSLRYPEDIEPDDDSHQYHIYISIRVKTRTGDLIVRVVHAPAENCRVMDRCGIRPTDISTEASPVSVQVGMQQ